MARVLLTSTPFLLLSSIGIYTTWGLSSRNGLFAEMVRIRDVGPWKLPGNSDLPLVRWYTGTDPIDYQLTVLQVFFANVVDGSSPPLSLFSFQFGGTFLAVMSVFLMEALRDGNRWRVVSFFATWGLLIQNFSYAVVAPLYCATHLATSPTTRGNSHSAGMVAERSLAVIPWSVMLGYLLPSVLMVLPHFSNEVHQYLVAFWQAFPLWMIMIQYILEGGLWLVSSPPGNPAKKEPSMNQYRKVLSRVYIFACLFSTLIHLASIARFVIPYIKSDFFKDGAGNQLSFADVFIPPRPDSVVPITEFSQGCLNFLQYDEYVGTLAVLIWAITLNANATASKRVNSIKDSISWIVKILGSCVLAGPGSAIVMLIWERDETVLDEYDLEQLKRQ